MSNTFKKNNKGTPPPLRKEKLRIADHFNSLVKSYVGDEAQRKTIMQAFLAKKPKSYAQINYKLYRFNTITLSVLHFISFLGAVSVVGYLQTLPIGATAHALSLMAVLFLLICEFGQHSMLNVAFENWHATNTVPIRIAIMCAFFSIVSIASSCFGTYHFAQTYNLQSNTIVMAMLALSGIVEVLILYTTLELHTYQKTVYQESILVNDMHHQNKHSIFFDSMPNVQRLGTYIINDDDDSFPEQAPKQAQRPMIINNGNTEVKAVTTSKSSIVDGWNKTDVNNTISSYKNKIRQRKLRGKNPTKDQLTNLHFFEQVKQSHDFRKGNFPKVDPNKRANYFDNLQTQSK